MSDLLTAPCAPRLFMNVPLALRRTVRLLVLSLALSALLVLAGCAAPPVYRLDAETPDATSDWIQGRQYITQSTDSLRATVAYVRTTPDGHMFDVHVENLSDTRTTAVPARFYADVYRAKPPTDTSFFSPDFLRRVWAVDPEERLLNLDQAAAENAADAATSEGLYLLTSVLDATADAIDGPDTREENREERVDQYLRREEQEDRRERYLRTRDGLESQRIRWSTQTLRKTTLPPMTGVRGYVYVPVEPDGRFLLLHISVDDETIVFPYRQKEY